MQHMLLLRDLDFARTFSYSLMLCYYSHPPAKGKGERGDSFDLSYTMDNRCNGELWDFLPSPPGRGAGGEGL